MDVRTWGYLGANLVVICTGGKCESETEEINNWVHLSSSISISSRIRPLVFVWIYKHCIIDFLTMKHKQTTYYPFRRWGGKFAFVARLFVLSGAASAAQLSRSLSVILLCFFVFFLKQPTVMMKIWFITSISEWVKWPARPLKAVPPLPVTRLRVLQLPHFRGVETLTLHSPEFT